MSSPTLRASNVWPIDGGDDILQITGQGGAVLGGITAGGAGFGGLAGGGTPAGTGGDIQFNNNGIFGTATQIVPGAFAGISNEGSGNFTFSVPGFFNIVSTANALAFNGNTGVDFNTAANITFDAGDSVNIVAENGGITVEADLGFIQFNTPTVGFSAGINVSGLQVFANNAAAISGGLNPGDLYRTGADPDPVCVVH